MRRTGATGGGFEREKMRRGAAERAESGGDGGEIRRHAEEAVLVAMIALAS